ncbi:fused MFS/spermidine synthase [Patescibacteria group bacterium]|nr:fused MFS/spermidine synthase [Patescibacteria group bacterium]MBU0964443.1 fused MFS/spermidine synthase [Patescibacteria group bacterium]
MEKIQNEQKINTAGWLASRNLLYALIFFSGLAALIYELVWIRLLNLTFGVSSCAVATVFAIFLLGLGLGSIFFGKKSEKTKNILKLYAWLELSIGLLSASIFIILQYTSFFDQIMSTSYNQFGFYGQSIIRLVIAAVILIAPTIAMGGTVPVVTKCLVKSNKKLGSQFSVIYYLNTLGAFCGAMLTGLLLVRFFGTIITFATAVIINLMIFAIIVLLAKKNIRPNDIDQHEIIDSADEKNFKPNKCMLPILFLTGFITLGLEVLWIRVLTNFGSGTTLASTLILGGFLIGFVIGSIYISRVIDRMKNMTWHFSVYAVMAGLLSAIILFIFSRLQSILSDQFGSYFVLLSESWIGFGLSFIIAIVLGTFFPLGVRLYAGNKNLIGKKTGRAYFINSLGMIAGSLAAGFVLIPFAGIKNTAIILIAMCLLIGIYFLIKLRNNKKLITFSITSIVITILIIFFTGPTFYRSPADNEQLFYAEGLSATITVHGETIGDSQNKYLNVDSQTVAGTYLTGIIDAKILAHLPVLLTDSPEQISTIGYGSGITTYSMSLYDAQVTALEIEQQVVEAAKDQFSDVNHRADTKSNVDIVIDDARNYLKNTDQKFDTIVTDVTNLKYKNNPYLYTTDYFQIMKDQLTPRGVAAAWAPLGGISPDDLTILIASFKSIFPHTTIWYYYPEPTGFLVFIGTPEKLVIDINTLAAKIEPVATDLQSIAINNAYDLSATLLLGEEDVGDLVYGKDLHTDDHPILEFSDLEYYAKFNPIENLAMLFANQSEILKPYYSFTEEQEQELLDALGNSRGLINHYIEEH